MSGPDGGDLTPEIISGQAFATTFRGYDSGEVRSFLKRVANDVGAWRERAEYLDEALKSALEKVNRPPDLDEEAVMAAVGEETASILRQARAAGTDMRAKAAAEAEQILEKANADAAEMTEDAANALDRATADAAESAGQIVAGARAEAAEVLERARKESDDIRAGAEKDRAITIEGANATGDEILADLAKRRRIATVQIEQLRAGRERLIESYAVVRRTLSEVQSELSRADAEARAAADEVGQRLKDVPDVELVEFGAPGAGPAVGADHAAPEAPASGDAVDALFDKVRAIISGENPTAEVEVVVVEGVGSAEVAPAEVAPAEVAPAETAPAEPAGGDEEPDREQLSDEDEGLLQRRETAVADLEVSLARRLKRALQDEQNDVLDRLRNLKGVPTAAKLLPAEADQVARYARASTPMLADAARAGAQFASGLMGGEVEAVDVSDLAGETATGLVEALRRQLEQSITLEAGDDQTVLVESIGAAYREWKTQRIERMAGDALSAAFSQGTWAATPEGAKLRWVVDDVDGPCPDCDDDVLAGDLPKGEVFPTGQHHPPAHSGCHCLLVPVAPAPHPASP